MINSSGILNGIERLDIKKENDLKKFLNKIAYERSFTELIIFDENSKIVAESELSFLFKSDVRLELLSLSKSSNRPAMNYSINEKEKVVSAISPINIFAKHYIYISKFKDLKVINDIKLVRSAVNNYKSVENKKDGLHITFTMIFIVVAVLLMFVAILMGLNFANGLVTPITNLANAADEYH